MRFGVLSDIHHRTERADAVPALLDDAVARFEEAELAFVAVLGDLVEDEDPVTDRQHAAAVRDRLDALSCPVYYTLGNHDVANLEPATVEDLLGDDARKRVTDHDVPLLFANTASSGRVGGTVDDDQLTWLDDQLAALDEAFVFSHHPLFRPGLSDNGWFEAGSERARIAEPDAVRNVLTRHGSVRGAFAGHIHEPTTGSPGGLFAHHVVSPFSKARHDSVEPTGAYAIAEYDPENETVKTDVRALNAGREWEASFQSPAGR